MTSDRPLSKTWLSMALLCGCSDAPLDTSGAADAGGAAFQELYDQGMDRYIGRFQPASSEELSAGVLTHSFRGEDGPLCFTGEPFHMSTRDGAGDALMVFLQGGGACGPNGCDAVESWPLGIPGPLQAMGILNADDEANPTADFDLAYLPYCDGSVWTGDGDADADGDGAADYRFRGLMNLSASLDVTAAQYPAPTRILVIGNSGGGFGVHPALPLLRVHYPDVSINLVNDSGVGILEPGGQAALNDYWDAWDVYPASCADCIGEDGNLTGYHRDQLDRDDNLRMGMMSNTRDSVILERLSMAPADWEAELLDAMAELEQAHPDRFRSFIAEGEDHTFILRDFDRPVGGTTPRAWIDALLAGGDWVSVSD